MSISINESPRRITNLMRGLYRQLVDGRTSVVVSTHHSSAKQKRPEGRLICVSERIRDGNSAAANLSQRLQDQVQVI